MIDLGLQIRSARLAFTNATGRRPTLILIAKQLSDDGIAEARERVQARCSRTGKPALEMDASFRVPGLTVASCADLAPGAIYCFAEDEE